MVSPRFLPVSVPGLPDNDSIDTKQQIHHIRRYSDYGILGSYSAVLFEPDFFAHRTCSILLVYVISRSSRSLRSCVVNCLHCLCVNCGRIFIHCRTASLSFILFIKPPYLLEFFFRIIFSFQNVQRQKLIIISFIFHL